MRAGSFYSVAEPMGESAWILRGLAESPSDFARQLNAAKIDGVRSAVASYDTVGVYVDPDRFRLDSLDARRLEHIPPVAPRTHTILVCYELGPDLVPVCEQLGLSEEAFIRTHSEPQYTCYAVGFCPGFPYLGWLPESISGVPRLTSPRVRVEPGSVGITGRQTGIYPLVRPGGWPIIGMTPLVIVDVEQSFFPILAGDLIQFEPISRSSFDKLKGERL